MIIEQMLFDSEALSALEGFFEVCLDLVGNDFCGLSFDIAPATELRTAGLTFDGGIVGYGLGHFESGLTALAAIEIDADLILGHDKPSQNEDGQKPATILMGLSDDGSALGLKNDVGLSNG